MAKAFVLCLLGLALVSEALATTIYRTTDAQGKVIFTDDPERGGEPVELAPLTVIPSQVDGARAEPPRVEGVAPRMGEAPGQPFMPYDTFRIRSPQHGADLPASYAGNLQVELAIEPELRPDHRVQLLVDGRVSQTPMHTRAFMLNDLGRGEYVLQAELLDAQGQVRHRSSPVSLYVQRVD
ncbi:DUF4124 domain-containing protein [Halomonas sp. MCCC 1A17488]|uniref:DUF4124 domain-containing protein n=1 Tax=unclassified Halomonas TaxID=2609666 RepID=UPI0018D24E2F|nr:MULTISPECIES: DUF4124 domain-containing protein [unclassified Halomonas]MCE8016902.1 DUF4124 domain-containing protein [Halomonas sp. MCCC 1A17488]MCG3240235.1 DUF4124 domain-containing protein [Halomonas sp. MCCC 1A17488]QPP49888.1 DUF4124 domain-containing protein [Halomonas sp. SS10-MC5]